MKNKIKSRLALEISLFLISGAIFWLGYAILYHGKPEKLAENKCDLPKQVQHLCGMSKGQLYNISWHASRYELLEMYALVSSMTSYEDYLKSFGQGLEKEEAYSKMVRCNGGEYTDKAFCP